METYGRLEPADTEAARDTYEELGTTAQVVVRELARAMDFDSEEYDERVDEDVVGTARDAIFASLLSVRVSSREEFEDWRDTFDGAVDIEGSEHVDNIVWHVFDGEAAAATYQNEREAAVATLRRQAFGKLYKPLFYADADDPGD